MVIPGILLREDFLKLGLRIPIDWDTEAAPHACCFGTTGSGKTVCMKRMLGLLSKYGNARLTVCDGKGGGDFDFLQGCDRYASVDVTEIFDNFYNSFLARQKGEDESRDIMALIFDEWSAYADNCSFGSGGKKHMEAQRMKLGQLLRLGRSFRTHVLISQQRMDSTYFQGFRENFNIVIGLSNLSRESRDMFFSSFKGQIQPDRGRGTGYMTINGAGFTPVAVPRVKSIERLHRAIYEGVTR